MQFEREKATDQFGHEQTKIKQSFTSGEVYLESRLDTLSLLTGAGS